METLTPKLILVPTDFGAPSAHALRYAANLGDRFGAHLLVLYADLFIPPIDFTAAAAGVFDIARDDLIANARERLQGFAETNIAPSVPYDVRVSVGSPTDTIVDVAAEIGANLIVMGTHGRSGLLRLLAGSVTEEVVKRAPVPVIAVNELARESSAIRLIVGREADAPESRAAIRQASLLAEEGARFVTIAEAADVVESSRAEGADLIALGITRERGLAAAVRHSNCPVLTVNRDAMRSIGADADVHELAIQA